MMSSKFQTLTLMLQRFFVIVLVCFLTACSSYNAAPLNPESTRSVEVAKLTRQLESEGVNVVQTGQTMRIIIPSDQLFNSHSANFGGPSCTGILNNVSRLMLMLETTSVGISGYTDVECSNMQNKSLAAEQARVVANQLWAKGMDARLVYSAGYDSTGKVLAMPDTFAGNPARRIEVQFQYLPLLSSLVN